MKKLTEEDVAALERLADKLLGDGADNEPHDEAIMDMSADRVLACFPLAGTETDDVRSLYTLWLERRSR